MHSGPNIYFKKTLEFTVVYRFSYLSESKLYGNLFVLNVAGFETTASAMLFALSFLALHEDIQKWVIDEVDCYYTTSESQNYAEVYPNLVRCLACLYETLRLASPAPLLVREAVTPQKLPISKPEGENTIQINPGTLVGGHMYGAHLSSRWELDAKIFNPKRFFSRSVNGIETLNIPSDIAFLPWMTGPRACPGKKFSQVEFVAVLASVLSRFYIKPQQDPAKTDDVTRSLLKETLDRKYFNISAHLRHPENSGLVFIPRNP